MVKGDFLEEVIFWLGWNGRDQEVHVENEKVVKMRAPGAHLSL